MKEEEEDQEVEFPSENHNPIPQNIAGTTMPGVPPGAPVMGASSPLHSPAGVSQPSPALGAGGVGGAGGGSVFQEIGKGEDSAGDAAQYWHAIGLSDVGVAMMQQSEFSAAVVATPPEEEAEAPAAGAEVLLGSAFPEEGKVGGVDRRKQGGVGASSSPVLGEKEGGGSVWEAAPGPSGVGSNGELAELTGEGGPPVGAAGAGSGDLEPPAAHDVPLTRAVVAAVVTAALAAVEEEGNVANGEAAAAAGEAEEISEKEGPPKPPELQEPEEEEAAEEDDDEEEEEEEEEAVGCFKSLGRCCFSCYRGTQPLTDAYVTGVVRCPLLCFMVFYALFMGLIVLLWPSDFDVETNFDSFMRADGSDSSRRDAFLAALAQQEEDKPRGSDASARRLSGLSLFKVNMFDIYYEARDPDAAGALSVQALDQIKALELRMRSSEEYKRVCMASSAPSACDPGTSFFSYVFPSDRGAAEGGGESTNEEEVAASLRSAGGRLRVLEYKGEAVEWVPTRVALAKTERLSQWPLLFPKETVSRTKREGGPLAIFPVAGKKEEEPPRRRVDWEPLPGGVQDVDGGLPPVFQGLPALRSHFEFHFYCCISTASAQTKRAFIKATKSNDAKGVLSNGVLLRRRWTGRENRRKYEKVIDNTTLFFYIFLRLS